METVYNLSEKGICERDKDMEILKIYVNIIETNEVVSENATVRMLLFDGYCVGKYFNGTILSGGVDTQMISEDKTILSARYMLAGYDSKNVPCRLFIENNAEAEEGITYTRPKIYTDSSDLKWLETEELIGRIAEEDGKLVIIIDKADSV